MGILSLSTNVLSMAIRAHSKKRAYPMNYASRGILSSVTDILSTTILVSSKRRALGSTMLFKPEGLTSAYASLKISPTLRAPLSKLGGEAELPLLRKKQRIPISEEVIITFT